MAWFGRKRKVRFQARVAKSRRGSQDASSESLIGGSFSWHWRWPETKWTGDCYGGVAHPFFVLGPVVKDAAAARARVTQALNKAIRHGIIGKIADSLN